MTSAPSAPREPLPDALRALALAGVLLVNAAGYLSSPFGPVLGTWPDSTSSWLFGLQGLYAFGVQGKAYPALAFLFGMGLWFATRRGDRRAAMARARQRQGRLLALGLVHGLLVYFGDILTLYAVVGALLLQHVHEPWGLLRRRLWRALGWAWAALAIVLAMGVSALLSDSFSLDAETTEPSFASVQRWPEFLALNVNGYLWLQAGLLVAGLPLLRLCMLGGVAAARLRLLTHRRWRGRLRRWLIRWAAPALLLNAAYAGGYIALRTQRDLLALLETVGVLGGPLLSAVLVVAFALHTDHGRAPWLRRLAPLGQRTLTLYVGHSLVCVLLFSGSGLGLVPQLGGLLVFSVLLWTAAWGAALASGNRRWPLEAWLARR